LTKEEKERYVNIAARVRSCSRQSQQQQQQQQEEEMEEQEELKERRDAFWATRRRRVINREGGGGEPKQQRVFPPTSSTTTVPERVRSEPLQWRPLSPMMTTMTEARLGRPIPTPPPPRYAKVLSSSRVNSGILIQGKEDESDVLAMLEELRAQNLVRGGVGGGEEGGREEEEEKEKMEGGEVFAAAVSERGGGGGERGGSVGREL
jgi:hypothetical protein